MKRIIAIIIACVLFLGLTACGSDESSNNYLDPKNLHYTSQSEKSLEEMLTAHIWVRKLSEYNHLSTFEFKNDGTFFCTDIEEKYIQFKGNWEIKYNEKQNHKYAVLQFYNMMINKNNEGWEKHTEGLQDNPVYVFKDDIDDSYIDNLISDSTKLKEDPDSFYDNIDNEFSRAWYVSDKYMAHGRGFYRHWRICVPK